MHRAADAVEAVHKDFLDLSVFHVGEQPLKRRTVDILARKAFVGVYLAGLRFAGGQGVPAKLRLLFDRDAVRALDGLPGVDRDDVAFSFPLECGLFHRQRAVKALPDAHDLGFQLARRQGGVRGDNGDCGHYKEASFKRKALSLSLIHI